MTIYTVKPGDSIFSIARAFGIPPSRIITDNFLTDPGNLIVGEDLVILFPNQTHTVMGGETLSSIAEMYGQTLVDMYRNNPVLDGMPSVFPGQVLNISYDAPPLGDITTNGYAYPYIDRTVLRRTLPYLTYLSIFTYGIEDNGELIEPTGGDDELIAIAKEYGTVPLMMLTSLNSEGKFSNELAGRVLSDPALRATVVENTASTMRAKGYGGVDVDFEYVPGEYADEYGQFISELQAALGEEYPVFVSLAPKYSADQPGLLYEGHNYGLLGSLADYVLLMTYEWGYTYGPPMAVSPIDQVKRVVDYALSEIESSKIQLGVPNYGYDWALPYVRGESRARSLSNVEAVDLAREKNAAIEFDSTAMSPFFRYYDRPQSFADAVEHIVWFENARSVEAMLQLVSENSLNGASVWNIMRYFPAMWSVLNALYSIRKL
ncbi:MAG: LysM peptidoglycan-binding domain-containing protein [Clostridiales bacterium]|nr:LysM peptidoglycan-binding domain-containing protein [Clostridiales bacterium]